MKGRYVLLWVKNEEKADAVVARYSERPGHVVLGAYPAPATWCYCASPKLVRWEPTRDHLVDYCTKCGGARIGFDSPPNLLYEESVYPARDNRPGTVVQFGCYFPAERRVAAGAKPRKFPEPPPSSTTRAIGHDRRQLPGVVTKPAKKTKSKLVRRKR